MLGEDTDVVAPVPLPREMVAPLLPEFVGVPVLSNLTQNAGFKLDILLSHAVGIIKKGYGYTAAFNPPIENSGVIEEILVPPIDITGAREKRDTVGAIMTTFETSSTTAFDSTITAPAVSGPASTLTSISVLPYATVMRTIPVASHVIVKLPFVED